jgi:hypothetical protein
VVPLTGPHVDLLAAINSNLYEARQLIRKYDTRGVFKEADIIWHYTDTHGLFSILEKNELWASNLLFLNDTKEIYFVYEKLITSLSKDRTLLPGTEKRAKSIVSILHKALHLDWQPDVFCTCFCEDSDLLSQWKGYGNGIAIGFDRFYLEDGFFPDTTLVKINYEDQKTEELVDDVVVSLINAAEKLGGEFTDMDQAVADAYTHYLKEIMPLCKHPKFSEEREWRLIRREKLPKEGGSWRFRVRSGRPIPYVILKRDKHFLPIKKIKFGPALDDFRTRYALYKFLEANSYGHIEPEFSEIPYKV